MFKPNLIGLSGKRARREEVKQHIQYLKLHPDMLLIERLFIKFNKQELIKQLQVTDHIFRSRIRKDQISMKWRNKVVDLHNKISNEPNPN